MPLGLVGLCAVLGLWNASPAMAEHALQERGRTSLLPLSMQPAEPEPGASPAPADAELKSVPKRFGEQGSEWLTIGLLGAHDFYWESNDFNIHGAYSIFLSNDVEFAVELAAWAFFQSEDNAVGLNPSIIFRWHFWHRERWTTYVDLGIGVLASTDDVPDNGTSLNFTPKGGVGLTYQLWEDRETRLQAGFRWHHVSNARITGDSNNPARDAPALYVGLIFPW